MARGPRDKAAVFIDGGYLNAVLKSYFQEIPLDYLAFSEELCGSHERFRTYYYNCSPYQSATPTPEERQRKAQMDKFLYSLQRLPRFEVKLGTLIKTTDPNHPFRQKAVDVLLAIDLTQTSATRTVDKAILVSGDSDFCPAVRRAKENMTLVELAYHPGQVSDELYGLCDDRRQLDKDFMDRVRFQDKT
jgi:uncharacterized LabA/DUF88 family protein